MGVWFRKKSHDASGDRMFGVEGEGQHPYGDGRHVDAVNSCHPG